MAEPDYIGTINRIISILKSDRMLGKMIKEFRFGELPEQTLAHERPACYVTLSQSPEMERVNISPTDNDREAMQRIVTEYWIILISQPGGVPSDAQKEIYTLRSHVIRILKNNKKLKLKTRSGGTDPKCAASMISSQSRLTAVSGKLVDSMTIMLRTVNFA